MRRRALGQVANAILKESMVVIFNQSRTLLRPQNRSRKILNP